MKIWFCYLISKKFVRLEKNLGLPIDFKSLEIVSKVMFCIASFGI